jgi:hypothetical protein
MIIIDGHNLLFQRKDEFKPNIETEIDRQTKLISSLCPNKKVILVYDGTGGGLSEHGFEKNVSKTTRIVYSGKHRNADNWIVNYISIHPQEMISLITNDLGLRNRTKVKRVKHFNCLDWFNKISDTKKISKRNKNEFGSQEYWEDYFSEN